MELRSDPVAGRRRNLRALMRAHARATHSWPKSLVPNASPDGVHEKFSFLTRQSANSRAAARGLLFRLLAMTGHSGLRERGVDVPRNDRRVIVVTSAHARNAAAVAALELRNSGLCVEFGGDNNVAAHDLVLVVEAGTACGDRALKQVIALRSHGCRAPILVLCEDSSHVAACCCFEAGADDYVRAPYEAAELAARLTRLRSRCSARGALGALAPQNGATAWIVGPDSVVVSEHEQSVRIGGYEATLQDLSFQVFMYLKRRAGVWSRRGELIERVLCRKAASAAIVRWHIHCIRDALGPHHPLIHGDAKLGYMFSFRRCKRGHCLSGLRARDRFAGEEHGLG